MFEEVQMPRNLNVICEFQPVLMANSDDLARTGVEGERVQQTSGVDGEPNKCSD